MTRGSTDTPPPAVSVFGRAPSTPHVGTAEDTPTNTRAATEGDHHAPTDRADRDTHRPPRTADDRMIFSRDRAARLPLSECLRVCSRLSRRRSADTAAARSADTAADGLSTHRRKERATRHSRRACRVCFRKIADTAQGAPINGATAHAESRLCPTPTYYPTPCRERHRAHHVRHSCRPSAGVYTHTHKST